MSSSDPTPPARRREDEDDSVWRRPPPGEEPRPAAPLASDTPAQPGGYSGPPRAAPPPPGWSPPRLVSVPPPHELPPQDLTAIDTAEQRARVFTYGVGIVVGAVMLILMCAVCARLIT